MTEEQAREFDTIIQVIADAAARDYWQTILEILLGETD